MQVILQVLPKIEKKNLVVDDFHFRFNSPINGHGHILRMSPSTLTLRDNDTKVNLSNYIVKLRVRDRLLLLRREEGIFIIIIIFFIDTVALVTLIILLYCIMYTNKFMRACLPVSV